MSSKIIKWYLFVVAYILTINAQCWMPKPYERGLGKPVSVCDGSDHLEGGICIKDCDYGYSNVGPLCVKKCDYGYTDTGIACVKLPDVYSKGCCCIKFFKKSKCCDNCRDGYSDIGCMCSSKGEKYIKESYNRGTGSFPRCEWDKENNAGLCYPKCRVGFNGVGPMCLANSCFGALGYECGLLCAANKKQCNDLNMAIGLNSASISLTIVKMIATSGLNPLDYLVLTAESAKLTAILINDQCDWPNKLPTLCIKDSNDGLLTICDGDNSYDCGLFCASSKMKCVKEIVNLSAMLLGITKFITGKIIDKPNYAQLSTARNFIYTHASNLKDFISKFKNAYKYGPKALETFGIKEKEHNKAKSFVLGYKSVYYILTGNDSQFCKMIQRNETSKLNTDR